MVYAISERATAAFSSPRGRRPHLRMRDGEAALIANVPEKQVVSISSSGDSTIVTTTTAEPFTARQLAVDEGEFRSAAKRRRALLALRKLSHRRQRSLPGAGRSVPHRHTRTRMGRGALERAGESTHGHDQRAAGRFCSGKSRRQKVPLTSSSMASRSRSSTRNAAPVIDAISVQDPAVVFISSGYPASRRLSKRRILTSTHLLEPRESA